MFDNFKTKNYPYSQVSPEMDGRHLSRLFVGDVIDGLTLAPGTGLQVVLAPGNTFIRYGSGAVASARLVSLIDDFALSFDIPDVSNPRIDAVVVYIDNSETLPVIDEGNPPTSANTDGPGVAKAVVVKGTPNANPQVPNNTVIQAAIESGNPYTLIGTVRVNPGDSVIAGARITDTRDLARIDSERLDYATFDRAKIRYTGAQLANNTQTNLTSRVVDIDVGGGTVGTTGWTAPYDCDVQISAALGMTNLEGRVEVRLLKNGSLAVMGFGAGTESTHDPVATISEVFRVEAGDVFTLSGYAQRNSGSTSIAINSSSMSIQVIARL